MNGTTKTLYEHREWMANSNVIRRPIPGTEGSQRYGRSWWDVWYYRSDPLTYKSPLGLRTMVRASGFLYKFVMPKWLGIDIMRCWLHCNIASFQSSLKIKVMDGLCPENRIRPSMIINISIIPFNVYNAVAMSLSNPNGVNVNVNNEETKPSFSRFCLFPQDAEDAMTR